jgi:hypothetical protein
MLKKAALMYQLLYTFSHMGDGLELVITGVVRKARALK